MRSTWNSNDPIARKQERHNYPHRILYARHYATSIEESIKCDLTTFLIKPKIPSIRAFFLSFTELRFSSDANRRVKNECQKEIREFTRRIPRILGINSFLGKRMSRSRPQNATCLCKARRGCERRDTTANNNERLILFERALRTREREESGRTIPPFSCSPNYGSAWVRL